MTKEHEKGREDTPREDGLQAQRIRVATVEDHDQQRFYTATLLERVPNRYNLVGSFRDADTALAELPSLAPDIVLMDIGLPGKSGIECVRSLAPQLPKTQFMMLTVVDDQERIFQSIMAGATGYLLKKELHDGLLPAMEELLKGGSPISPSIARKVLKAFAKKNGKTLAANNLSPREIEVLECLSKGFYYKEIKDALGISFDTVRKHINNIYRKLQVNSRAEAVAMFQNSRPPRL